MSDIDAPLTAVLVKAANTSATKNDVTTFTTPSGDVRLRWLCRQQPTVIAESGCTDTDVARTRVLCAALVARIACGRSVSFFTRVVVFC